MKNVTIHICHKLGMILSKYDTCVGGEGMRMVTSNV